MSHNLTLRLQGFGGNPAKVIYAEVMMAQFIALPFQAADHLSDLVSSVFPDSRIAADFSSKHTKTKCIICDALDPYLKEPVVDFLEMCSL